MPVFISYRNVDRVEAANIASSLKLRGVTPYIDILNPELKSTDDITSAIMSRISVCTHIMAVISSYANGSWWVPFKIGLASKAERRITTYRINYADLSQYLSKWPILESQSDLEKFVLKYREDALVLFNEGQTYRAKMAQVKSADQFHRALKRDLAQ